MISPFSFHGIYLTFDCHIAQATHFNIVLVRAAEGVTLLSLFKAPGCRVEALPEYDTDEIEDK